MAEGLHMGILVVDDQPENRLLMTEYLEDLGLPVDVAESGEKCLELLNQKKFTLVIMDIQMPGLNGFEVLKIMRKDEKLRDIPVVFVSTVFDSDQYILRGINEGAIDFIAKPVNINILKSKVSNFIKLYEKQAKLDEAVKNLEMANSRLKANERKIKGITNSASDSIILLDSGFRINFWNKASTEIFGYSKYEIITENFFEKLLDQKSKEILEGRINSLLKTANNALSNSIRLTGIKKTGTEFPMELSLSFFVAEGNQINYTIIIRDITHNIKIEKEALKTKELKEANKMMREFINNVSHELRTPMNAILGISNMLQKYNSQNLSSKQIEGLQIINQSGTRLLDMINDILDLAKLEAGKVSVTKEEIDLEKFLASIRSMVLSLIDKKDIKFIILKSPQVPINIISDTKKLNQILLNLLSNAVKFTPKGKIHLFIHHRKDRIIFEVTDTGIGISDEDLPIIFDKFQQIDNSESKEYKGSGLGLHISKNLADLMGGTITAESKPGKGTTMRLNIPANSVLPITLTDKEKDERLNEPLIYKNIIPKQPLAIIIDDNEENTFWYESILKEYHFSVFTFTDSGKGLSAIKQFLPELILLKLEMPKMHGHFILDQIAEIETLKSSQLIIFTSVEKLRIQNINNPHIILNEPYNVNDIIKYLDKQNIQYSSAVTIDWLFLYQKRNSFKDALPNKLSLEINSLNSIFILISHLKIKELVIESLNKSDINQLISWLNANCEVSPESIIIISKTENEKESYEINIDDYNIPEILIPKLKVLSIQNALKEIKLKHQSF
jgi:PAS domain S-box-containing protein